MPYCGCDEEYMKMDYGQQYGLGWVYTGSNYVEMKDVSLYNPWFGKDFNTERLIPGIVDGKEALVPNPMYGKGLGFDFGDVTGGFSIQTVLLIGGVGLVLWMMMSGRGGQEFEYRQAVIATKGRVKSIKQKLDSNVSKMEGYLETYRKTGLVDVDAIEDITKRIKSAEDAL